MKILLLKKSDREIAEKMPELNRVIEEEKRDLSK